MSDSIIVALLSLLGTLFGSWMGVHQANKLVAYRIEQLEKKVDKHNHLVERMTIVETKANALHQRVDIIAKELLHE